MILGSTSASSTECRTEVWKNPCREFRDQNLVNFQGPTNRLSGGANAINAWSCSADVVENPTAGAAVPRGSVEWAVYPKRTLGETLEKPQRARYETSVRLIRWCPLHTDTWRIILEGMVHWPRVSFRFPRIGEPWDLFQMAKIHGWNQWGRSDHHWTIHWEPILQISTWKSMVGHVNELHMVTCRNSESVSSEMVHRTWSSHPSFLVEPY